MGAGSRRLGGPGRFVSGVVWLSGMGNVVVVFVWCAWGLGGAGVARAWVVSRRQLQFGGSGSFI